MKIVFLGTGDAFSSEGRANASIFLDGEYKILLDCSPQAVNGLRKCGYRTNEIQYVFISHLHGDHAGGLPFLILSLLFRDRGKVTISGPKELKDFTVRLYDMFFGAGNPADVLDFKSLDADYPFGFFHISAKHPVPAYIYKIVMEGKTTVYSGDTARLDLDAFAKGADCLIHEGGELNEKEAREYGHSTAIQAAEVARSAGVKRLAITHRPQLSKDIIRTVKKIFPNTVFPEDYQMINL